ncbi:MAG: hypothetical protein U0163_20280, partial [Gemmatimonadaceae bacterium]
RADCRGIVVLHQWVVAAGRSVTRQTSDGQIWHASQAARCGAGIHVVARECREHTWCSPWRLSGFRWSRGGRFPQSFRVLAAGRRCEKGSAARGALEVAPAVRFDDGG